MVRITKQLKTLLRHVEESLASFYDFVPLTTAAHHLVTREELISSLGDKASRQSEFAARGGVWMLPDESGDVFVGLHLSDSISTKLFQSDPRQKLSDYNLDEFCILVEEVSHFHLLINRATSRRPVSKLELEFQGEVDKLLISGMTLERQCGDPHLVPLARKLYDLALINDMGADEHERYRNATKYAARFWYDAIDRSGGALPQGQLRDFLKRNYRSTWHEKKASLESEALPIAS